MAERVREIVTSALLLSVVGYVVWPLGDVPWRWVTYLPESLAGDLEVLVLVLLVTGAVGFGTLSVSSLHLSNLAVGGVLAYLFWMAALTLVFSFHEPLLPVIAYGLVLVGVLLGAVLETAIARGSSVDNHTRSS